MTRLDRLSFEDAGATSIPSLFNQRVEETPDAVAIRGILGELTFSEWHSRSGSLAQLIRDQLGRIEQERVLIWMSNDEATLFVSALQAVFNIGAVAVALDDRSTAVEAQGIIEETEPRAILLGRQVAQNLGERGLKDLGLAGWSPDPDPEVVYLLTVDDRCVTGAPLAWAPTAPAPGAPETWARSDHDAFIAYTSGSTGRPKGAIWSQAAVVQYAERAARAIYSLPRGGPDLGTADVLQSPIPLYTAASLIENLYPAVFSGCSLIYEGRRFDPAASEQRMRDNGTTAYNGAPPHFAMMCDLPPGATPESLDVIVSGGSAFTAPLYERMRERWPNAGIANWYGLNESGTGQTLNYGADIARVPQAIGRPIEPTEVKVVDADGNELSPGTEGELWMRAPGQMREYFRNPEQTAIRFHRDWLRTGDQALIDVDGVVHVVGRNEERINRGGFKFYPAEIEAALERHEGVREATVIAVAHDTLGQDAVAFVVLADGATVDGEELRGFCRERIAPNKVPSQVLIREQLPRGAYGKVVRRKLRDEYEALARTQPSQGQPARRYNDGGTRV
jgi:acyl-CoA synthetase (AMP-forming)/AMP-acid ligase II